MTAKAYPLPPTKPAAPVAPAPAPTDIDAAEWEQALEETRQHERELGKRLFPNGKPIPILSSDDYDL
jgi:hypothetical protein